MTTVIVGGVAGGMSAAARLRRLDDAEQIIVVERTHYVSYANCGLPYHVSGVIGDRDDLLLQSPEALASQLGLDVRVDSEVLSVDRGRATLRVRHLPSGHEYDLGWDHLVLSPGATPFVPDVPGVERAMMLRNVEDMDRIKAAVANLAHTEVGTPTAVVVGGGFIGLELAENLAEAAMSVTVVELADQVLAPLDPEMAVPVQAELEAHGVNVELGASLTKVLPAEVEVSDGRCLPADLVVMAIGVRPDADLARRAGLAVGPTGAIAVDERMRTSDPRIYAIGDAVEKTAEVDGGPLLVPLANIANRQGRMVADDIAGKGRDFRPVLGTAIIKVFGLTAAVTGANEKRLRALGRPYLAVHTHPGSHAGYYPGSERVSLKLLVCPATGAILGAQAVGRQGADKRIDVIATAMRAGLTAADLADLELAYAPPYGSAKDPVNMLGYVASNRLSGQEPTVQWYEVEELAAAGALLVDVRTPREHVMGHIPGSVNIPLDQIRNRSAELEGRRVVVYCQVGQRAHTAGQMLKDRGHDVVNLDGGYLTWRAGKKARRP
jgi:NADPH-dependent 2,4-dienoyl-CoA reductase/sulfur reductase-like enzyme/rhodanese-related sulfurtransferase